MKIAKSEISSIDYSTGRELPTDNIRYKVAQLVLLSPKSPFKYLGILLRLDMDDTDATTYVKTQTAKAIDKLANTCYTAEQLLTLLSASYRSSDTQHQYTRENQPTCSR